MTEHGPMAEDATGAARLHLAAWNDDARAITRLGLAWAELDARDGYGRTALHLAAITRLAHHGAELDARDRHGLTALHYAAERRRRSRRQQQIWPLPAAAGATL